MAPFAGVAAQQPPAGSKARVSTPQQNAVVRRLLEGQVSGSPIVDDETAMRRRIELAAESKAIREAGARMIAQRNAEMRRRIKRAQSRTNNKKDRVQSAPVRSEGPKPEDGEQLRAQQAADDEAAELRLLRSMLARSAVAEGVQEGGWNPSPHRPVPYPLRGMRPMHSREPWSQTAIEKSHELRLPAGHAYATSGLTRLDDGMRDDVAMLRRREKVEERQASAALSRPAWDPSQWRYCPPALMGLKPMTTEPWARDIEVYQAGSRY
jgi:hypothetical protein